MALELRNVSKRFGGQLALDGVSLRIEKGDCYGFIGHNGAGKTTAMRIALGLQRPDSGSVVVDGFDAARYPREARARLGALIETPGFQGSWSGTRNLAELARLQGMTRNAASAEARKWFDRVGLAHAGAKSVQHYSQGMRQRLGIASALLGSPRYVLLDEPTNGLDPEGIAEVRALVNGLRRDEGHSFLVSSHQLHELSAICNKIAVLRGGRLLADAETSTLLAASGARWRLEASDKQAAERVLSAIGVERSRNAPPDERGLWLDLGPVQSTAVTRALVERGIGVVSFAPHENSLEEIYLRFAEASRTQKVTAESPKSGASATAAPTERFAPSGPIARMAAFDLRRYVRSPGLWFLFTAPALLGIVACLRRGMQSSSDQSAIQSETLFSATGVNGFEAVGLALQAGLPLLAFLALGLASQSLAAEYARGTLRNILLRPLRRIECALGKGVALLAITLGSYALLVAAACALASALFDFGDVAEVLPNGQRFTLTPAAALWPEFWRALASPLLPLLTYAAIGFLCGAIARTGAGALGLALGTGVALDLSRALAREFGHSGVLPSDHLPSPLSDTSFLRFYVDSAQGVSNAVFEFPHASWIVPVAWTLACFAVASRILQNRAIP